METQELLTDDWVKRSACRDVDPAIFFPRTTKEANLRQWAKYCHSCPVRLQCALSVPEEPYGVWGGKLYHLSFSEPMLKVEVPKSETPKTVRGVLLYRSILGAFLRERRAELGRSLRSMATDVGVSAGYLSEIERGEKEPSSEILASICSVLGLTLSQMLKELWVEAAAAELSLNG